MVNFSFPRLVRAGVILLVVGTITGQPPAAQRESQPHSHDLAEPMPMQDIERFWYWTGCSPLRLRVLINPTEAVRMDLTQEAVATAVRSRLRAARLYTDTNNREVPLLMIYVDLVNSKRMTGGAFIIQAALLKHLYDPLSGLSFLAQTNPNLTQDSAMGLHAGKAAFIRSQIASVMDHFLDAYLRVNEPACY